MDQGDAASAAIYRIIPKRNGRIRMVILNVQVSRLDPRGAMVVLWPLLKELGPLSLMMFAGSNGDSVRHKTHWSVLRRGDLPASVGEFGEGSRLDLLHRGGSLNCQVSSHEKGLETGEGRNGGGQWALLEVDGVDTCRRYFSPGQTRGPRTFPEAGPEVYSGSTMYKLWIDHEKE